MTHKIATCLWFDDAGHEAAAFYVTLLPDSRIEGHFTPDASKPPMLTEFTLAGVPYQALNGGTHFTQSEAASIVVTTEDQAETDRLWDALLQDGGRESQCGWLKDRWGVSWQIVPRGLVALMARGGKAGAAAMAEMMTQVKLDIDAIRAAADAAEAD